MIVATQELLKIWLWIMFIHSFWKHKAWQVQRIIQISTKQWMASLAMSIRNQPSLKFETLEPMEAWGVVERQNDINVIRSTWAIKLKRYPDGLIKKFRAHLCAQGDMQLKGINFFETYDPVVQWTIIRLMLILEVLLGLKSKQVNVTAVFFMPI